MPRRRLAFLLMPLLALIFIIGWTMAFVGKPRSTTRPPAQKKKSGAEKESPDDLEVGLFGEVTEEQTATQ